MRIEVRGRNTDVTDELRGHVEKRFSRIGQQVSELAVLVDDVVTTGATIGVCARALRSGGCDRIVSLTFARS